MVSGGLSAGEGLAEVASDLEDTQGGFLSLFEFLFHGIVLGFEGQDVGVPLRKLIQVSLGLVRSEDGEFRRHEVADRADVLLVVNSGEDAVEEFGDVGAGEGGVEACVEGFVCALVLLDRGRLE